MRCLKNNMGQPGCGSSLHHPGPIGGWLAQMAKASGSYPEDRQFESDTSYQETTSSPVTSPFSVACGFLLLLFFLYLKYIFLLCTTTSNYQWPCRQAVKVTGFSFLHSVSSNLPRVTSMNITQVHVYTTSFLWQHPSFPLKVLPSYAAISSIGRARKRTVIVFSHSSCDRV